MIKIVTDSTSDIPVELIEKYDIKVVPLNVHFGDEVYKDGVDLLPEAFYEKLAASQDHPKTSQPSPGVFMEAYNSLKNDGATTIISIHLSSGLSGTVQAARLAVGQVDGVDIEVIDSASASMALGYMVLEAAKMAGSGHAKEEILDRVNQLKQKTFAIFMVDDLKYLQKGGRIPKALALMGTLLNLKPILHVNDKQVHLLEKVRGKAKAMDRLVQIVKESTPPDGDLHVCILSSADDADAALLLDKLKQALHCKEIMKATLGPVIGTHVGPGTLGIGFFAD